MIKSIIAFIIAFTLSACAPTADRLVSLRDSYDLQLDYVLDTMQISDGDYTVYDYSDLDIDTLENRNGKIIIEVVEATCLDDDGNGEQLDGYYISFEDVPGHKAGRTIRSFMIYNPDTNYCDDIVERFDFILN